MWLLFEFYLSTDIDNITHRLATIQKADQILVVENGKIVGCGRQEELLSEFPLYQRLWSDYASSADQVEGGTF